MTPVLAKVSRVWRMLNMVGSHHEIGAQYWAGRDATTQKCWSAFHLRSRFWRVRGRAQVNDPQVYDLS